MNRSVKTFDRVGETMHSATLSCGLTVHILPKKGFAKKSVSYLVRFGSMHRFVQNESGNQLELPEGIHHFIEHLLFESGAEDLSRQFLGMNAIVNAYTTTNRTVYYFQTTADILAPLRLLTRMVFHPEFAGEAIQKEAAIIESEFRMYEDEVEQSVYLDGLRALYFRHPIKDEVLGTIASIRDMTQDKIAEAYRLGYRKGNIELLIVGDVDVEETLAYVENLPEFKEDAATSRLMLEVPNEQDGVVSASTTFHKPINIAYASVTGKLPKAMLGGPLEAALMEIKLGFLLESLIGKQSKQYHDLIVRQLANDTLDFVGSVEPTFGFFRITTETRKIDATIEALKTILQNAASTPISQEQFLASRNRMIGSFYRSFNRIDGVANIFSDYLAKDVDVDMLMDAALSITKDDIVQLANQLQTAAICVLIHRPDVASKHGASSSKVI